jgi:predicted PurR-regulated permease PerM
MLQGLPGPHDYDGQKRIYAEFRQQVARISPVGLDVDYFPNNAEDSQLFLYVRETLQGPYVTDALLKIAWYGNNWLWQWVLIMFILLFLLLEGRMLTRRVVEIFGPSEEDQAHAVEALSDMARHVRVFLVWRTIINFGMAIVVGLVYQWLGLRQAWTWALLTAILCYVPYLGPIAAGVPPVIDAFLSCPSPWYVVALLVFYVGLITLEGYVIVPVVMGRNMELNATTVMLACLFWELVWGLPGLFLAMPLMAALKAVCSHVPGWRPWANLMSTSEVIYVPEKVAVRAVDSNLEDTQLITGPEAEAKLASNPPAMKGP